MFSINPKFPKSINVELNWTKRSSTSEDEKVKCNSFSAAKMNNIEIYLARCFHLAVVYPGFQDKQCLLFVLKFMNVEQQEPVSGEKDTVHYRW